VTVSRALSGHSDVLYRTQPSGLKGRAAGQALVENDPKHGKIYHLGNYRRHDGNGAFAKTCSSISRIRVPRLGGDFDGIKDHAHFLDANYRGSGVSLGMGLDGSEQRLCEYRCLPLLDDNEQLGGRQADAAQIHPADLGGL